MSISKLEFSIRFSLIFFFFDVFPGFYEFSCLSSPVRSFQSGGSVGVLDRRPRRVPPGVVVFCPCPSSHATLTRVGHWSRRFLSRLSGQLTPFEVEISGQRFDDDSFRPGEKLALPQE